ncbi:transcription factor [Pleurotus eryngii]|uniref:Transcription factor n=1 Tax=Pleurotus eryngii TaxID=5323 RepID=A0A9P5ZZ43_PLEER|nr:transcription factor [Pleurotus eryngii]
MQSGPRIPNQPPVKIYNAVYSSVQVYECMVRGIAVMRRRNDSYVNATQILKVAGVDKGRRTKILEKEILPGKHEIVQGGYGKYQGTWIPLERGRDIALQYGVAPLLSPLFDFTPSTNSLNSLNSLGVGGGAGSASPRPLSASSSFSSIGAQGGYLNNVPSTLAPPPIMPGSALRLLNQGRAQGLFTPSTSGINAARSFHNFSHPPPSQTPPPSTNSLKRNRSDTDVEGMHVKSASQPPTLEPPPEIIMSDASRPSSAPAQANGDTDGPSPTKRARTDATIPAAQQPPPLSWQVPIRDRALTPVDHSTPQPTSNGNPLPSNGKASMSSPTLEVYDTRFSTKPYIPRNMHPTAPLKDNRRIAVVNSLYQRDDPTEIIRLLEQVTPDTPGLNVDLDVILDEHGHTALHLAASLARLEVVQRLISAGADIHRGNHLGETPLIRACLATHNSDQQTFDRIVAELHASIRTLDTSKKSVVHHIVSVAGVKGRAIAARYYLDQIFYWIANHQGGDFRSLVDLQDEHGDTSLNIAARVGSRGLVRTLLDVGANRSLTNKLGLRPGDFGVETEELNAGPRADDILNSLRSGPSAPVQKSRDVIADMTTMIQGLSAEFQGEIKAKQDALDVTTVHLRAATRELSEQRKHMQHWQSRLGELSQVTQRIRNVEKATADEDNFDWTGRTDINGEDARVTAGPSFQWRGPGSTMIGHGSALEVPFNVDPEPPVSTTDSVANLIRLRRMKLWHARVEEMMLARLKVLQGASAEKEFMCKKIVALCTGIPVDKVESMLENLVVALESESSMSDIGRISGFMQKVRDGII